MTTIDDSPPNEVFLDLIQDNRPNFEILQKVSLYSPTVRMMDDVLPSVHSILDYATIEQRNIPRNTTVMETVYINLVMYTADSRDIWKFYQTIKQIIVKNNQVKSTAQYNFDVEWTNVDSVVFDVLADEREIKLHTVVFTLAAVFQNDYR